MLRCAPRIAYAFAKEAESKFGSAFAVPLAIAGVESALALFWHIEPPILQKGDEVVGGMAPNGVLEVDHAKPPQTASLLAQKKVGRMIVPEDEVLLLLAKPIEKGRPRFEKCARKRLGRPLRRKQLEIPLQKQVQLDLQRLAVELRNTVRRGMRHRKIARRFRSADRKQAIDGERIQRIELFAFRDESAEDRIAQIFDEKEAAIEVGSRHCAAR